MPEKTERCPHYGTRTAKTCRVVFFQCRGARCYYVGCYACLDAHEAACPEVKLLRERERSAV